MISNPQIYLYSKQTQHYSSDLVFGQFISRIPLSKLKVPLSIKFCTLFLKAPPEYPNCDNVAPSDVIWKTIDDHLGYLIWKCCTYNSRIDYRIIKKYRLNLCKHTNFEETAEERKGQPCSGCP